MIKFTGIQPSGDSITLGNYLGSIKPYLNTQSNKENSFFCIVDQHAITAKVIEPKQLYINIKTAAATYIALDVHNQANLYIQSHVHQHATLGWLLQCYTKTGELDRMTQFKEKGKNQESVNTALYTYPVLMAADILLYHTTHVPVGLDQKQHVELCRDIAQRFNSTYNCDYFTIPTPVMDKNTSKIYSLTEPLKKMSKSDENPKSCIFILDTPKQIMKKVKSATTDSIGVINYDPENQPGVSNLLVIYSACKQISMQETLEFFKNQQYGFLKVEVAQAIIDELEPFQQKYTEIFNDDKLIDSVLESGAQVASVIATQTIKDVNKIIGLK